MAHALVQATAIAKINSKVMKKETLGGDFTTLSFKWSTMDHSTLLATEFSEYWVIEKNTRSSPAYKMFCGSNVPWTNTHYAMPPRLPDIVLMFEDGCFTGILMGDVIRELAAMGTMGIFLWLSPVVKKTTEESLLAFMAAHSPRHAAPTISYHVPAPAPPVAYLRTPDGRLIPVPAGTKSIDVIPNQFEPLMNISHFRRR
jgi:hypothetical protein